MHTKKPLGLDATPPDVTDVYCPPAKRAPRPTLESVEAKDRFIHILLRCCETDLERDIATLSARGLIHAEIARELGVERSRVRWLRSKIRDRYDSLALSA